VTYATTEYIAGWLVEASKKIGFSLNDVQASLPVESQRLKGKDRKKAKEAAKAQLAAAAAAAKKQPSRYHIRASDFVPIAEAIAKHAKKVKVPSPLLTVFGRAIKARKEAQAWYKAANLEDEGHHHFISILSRVQEIKSCALSFPSPKLSSWRILTVSIIDSQI
jgi:pyruvate/2-oxoglutarate dehydrogenase complex dihydrolipoamide acyltransferase (E2) component